MVALLTGFSDGIGKATALDLARRGYFQILVGRPGAKSERSFQEIRTASAGRCEFLPCDLASLREVAELARRVGERERLDFLINNAGVFTPRRQTGADGYELMLAVNHLAPFLLSTELAPLLKKTARRTGDVRVINVSSAAYKNSPLDFDDLQHQKSFRAFFDVYSRSKLCNLYFSFEFARRLAGTGVSVNCLHPGIVGTGIGRGFGVFGRIFLRAFGKSAAEGARTTLWLATDSALRGVSGKFFVDRREEPPLPIATDEVTGQRLWEISEQLTRRARSAAHG